MKTVYAYGVKPLYGGPNGEHFQQMDVGTIMLWKPYAFLHYWIDQELQYHEEEKQDAEMPQMGWINGQFKVDLRGPRDYTISR